MLDGVPLPEPSPLPGVIICKLHDMMLCDVAWRLHTGEVHALRQP